jgi:site-specific recombinase XerD
MILHTKKLRKYIWQYRDHAIISLMMTSGLRRIEIIHAKKSDYQIIDQKAILYIKKKRSADVQEFVKISKGTQKALNDYLDRRKDDHPYLFIAHKNVSSQGHLSRTFFADMFPRILKSCGLEDKNITPNVLRQTAGMINLLRGGTLASTQSFLRHKHIESTLVYQEHLEQLRDDSAYKIDAFILKEEEGSSYNDFIDYFES